MNRRRRLLAVSTLLAVAAASGGCGEDSSSPVNGPPPGLAAYHLIAFVSDRSQPTLGLTDLYLYDVGTEGIIPLVGLNRSATSEHDPAISGDGQRLFFSSQRNQPGSSDIFAYDLTYRMFVALPLVNTSMSETEPGPSADGLHLAFVRQFGAGRRIFLVQGWPPESTIPLPGLDTLAAYDDFSPACDSTARRIAFTTNRANHADVMVWDRDSAGVLALPDLASSDEDVEPTITPSGRYVAFASNRPSTGGGYRIYLYDLEARAFVPLPGFGSDGEDRHPSLSWDAQRIAFQSTRTSGTAKEDIWIYERAQSRARTTPSLASAGRDLEPFLRYR